MNGDENAFGQLLEALEPWLGELVIVGGWAHQLYLRHPSAQQLDYPPLTTLDTDVAVPLNLAVRKESIHTRLLAHGFSAELMGTHQPAVTHYHLGSENSGFYAEFLTPLIGGEYRRDDKRNATVTVSGVSSQRLRYLELLLSDPWAVDFETGRFAAKVRIANPVSFIAQKILIHEKRDANDRAKDILYLHDTLQVFGARLHELQKLWRETVGPQLKTRSANTVLRASDALFGVVSDDTRRAVRIADERGLSPEAVREACQFGLNQVLR